MVITPSGDVPMQLAGNTPVIGGADQYPNLSNPGLWSRIQAIDLSMVKMKLMHPKDGKNWSQEKVDEVEKCYRRYLYLSYMQKDYPVVPTHDIDDFWHQHILDTFAYARDCKATFGEFMHHFPYLGLRGPEDALLLKSSFERTCADHLRIFNEPYMTSAPADCGDAACGCTKGCGSNSCGDGTVRA